ncbi:MAG TPA: response regulator transcription factor [Verrucomicrobiae bacterium]
MRLATLHPFLASYPASTTLPNFPIRKPLMRFLLVEDHPLMRTGLAQLLTRHFPSLELEEAADAASAMAKISASVWDLIIIDIELPDRSGVDLLADIRRSCDSPVLVLSGQSEREFGKRVLQAGAAGFLRKATDTKEIIPAIERVLAGHKYVSPDLAATILDQLQSPAGTEPHETLSTREFEVLRLLGAGLTATDIAHRLNISIKTVSTFRSRILEKLRLQSTGDIVRYAVERKLV